jgi:hypothetical protein
MRNFFLLLLLIIGLLPSEAFAIKRVWRVKAQILAGEKIQSGKLSGSFLLRLNLKDRALRRVVVCQAKCPVIFKLSDLSQLPKMGRVNITLVKSGNLTYVKRISNLLPVTVTALPVPTPTPTPMIVVTNTPTPIPTPTPTPTPTVPPNPADLTYRLFLATLRPSFGSMTDASGIASLRVNEEHSIALLAFDHTDLSSPRTTKFLLGPAGEVLLDLDTEIPDQNGVYYWFITDSAQLSRTEIISYIRRGKVTLEISSLKNPGGEIDGNFIRYQ